MTARGDAAPGEGAGGGAAGGEGAGGGAAGGGAAGGGAQPAPRPPRQHCIVAGAEPIRLGSMLVTLVEPHRGHEVAYNRWYERDHFYAGCMVGPYQFAGRRFVATAELKRLRDPDPSPVTGSPHRGTYLSLYWVLDGYHDVWNRWAVDQVKALHRAGRMFAERDHVHTLLYRFAWDARRPGPQPGDEGVPAELALDFPAGGLVLVWTDPAPGQDAAAVQQWLRSEVLPGAVGGSGAAVVVAATPLPLLIDAPGDVPRSSGDDGRLLTMWFLDGRPEQAWKTITGFRQVLQADGRASVVAALPFVPTVPGTDTYTDRLWVH